MRIKITKPGSLLDQLISACPDSSKTTLRSWIAGGRISILGKVTTLPTRTLIPGEEILIGQKGHFAEKGLKILYEDAHLVVVEKPGGLLSVASETQSYLTAHAILKRRRTQGIVYPVHRLDKETSGVMVFAYTQAAREKLKDLFAMHAVERQYVAWVSGKVDPKQGTWQSYLKDHEDCVVRQAGPSTGKLAITHYETIKNAKGRSLLKLTLETGRKNQIRVHCQAAGHPVRGDTKYGSSATERLYLHAFLLGFNHPITGKAMRFELPLPSDF